jgi:hypothetical protein
MKIYTKINYKWLDGQLVKTSSKSFEYEGDLTLCGGGGGGGKGGGGGGGSSISLDTVTSAIADPVGTVTGAVTDTVEMATDPIAEVVDVVSDPILEGMSTGGEVIGGNVNTALEMGNENLNAGLEGIGMNEGVATTLGDMGENINTNMAPLVRAGDQVTQYSLDRINAGMDYLGETAGHLTDFIHGTSSPSDVTIDPDKFAVDSSKKKKNKSDLAVNKAKKRSRSSLRIG